MPKLIVTRGLPGSGKSTWALKQVENDKHMVRVNRDSIRSMLHGKPWNPKYEDAVTKVRNRNIQLLLGMGYDVICDDTNLRNDYINDLRSIALGEGHEFILNDSFLEVSVEECIKRDLQRTASVGKDVIERMYYDYWKQQPKPVNDIHDPNIENAIICDLDGTISIPLPGANMYDRDYTKDEFNYAVGAIVASANSVHLKIFYTSGRKEQYREQTMQWLRRMNVWYLNCTLLMRKDDDRRKDTIVKKEMYMERINGKYSIRFVMDDRPSVVRMWRAELGLDVMQVGPNMEF